MRILYDVQGTGNGHISRARAMVPHLVGAGIDADHLLTVRSSKDYFDTEPFGNWLGHSGLTFASLQGRASPIGTFKGTSQFSAKADTKKGA